ncbi:MAG: Arc family DNA-binding protein [Gammaproteobacteria bacterium]
MSDRHVLPPYSLRMPDDLRKQLEVASKQTKRSLNAEIVARLEASFEPHPQIIIVDEAHRSEGASPERALALIEQLKGELVAFTATPKK